MRFDPHWYYLHTNGELIHKRWRPDPSDFVVQVWCLDPAERVQAWNLVIEALALGADLERVRELCEHWGIVKKDLPIWLDRADATDERRNGLRILIEKIWGDKYDDVMNPGPMLKLVTEVDEREKPDATDEHKN